MRYIFISAIFFNVFWNCCSNAQQFSMGIEVESPSIKTYTKKEKKFFFKKKTETVNLFCLEQDTPDKTFFDNHKYQMYNKNLEIKTIGGFNNKELKNVTSSFKLLLDKFYNDKKVEINDHYLNRLLAKSQYTVSYSSDDTISIQAKENLKETYPIIRLQITYQLPLSKISKVFERLAFFEHKDIKIFIRDLDPNKEIPKIDWSKFGNEKSIESINKDKRSMIIIENRYKSNNISNYFKKNISRKFNNLPESDSKGLIQLFLFYWHSLFNNKEQFLISETGLKQYLGIMSRIPFSQLYDRLSFEEKKKFVEFLEPYMIKIEYRKEKDFNLRMYINNQSDMEEITLPKWFYSIIGSKSATKITLPEEFYSITDVPTSDDRRSTRVKHLDKEKETDILSPPPTSFGTNSMGAYDIENSKGLALIEVRGYNPIEDLTSKDLPSFVEKESEWFFNLEDKE